MTNNRAKEIWQIIQRNITNNIKKKRKKRGGSKWVK